MQSEPRAPVEADNSPRLDSELLLAHALGQTRTWLYTWPDAELDPDDVLRANALLERRAAGEPVAYLTGLREFWSMNLEVSPAVLVPRPDTELLVEQALAFTEANAAGQIIELGTGSGAIAIALATECSWPIIATDRSAAALDVARRNAERLAPGRITFVQGDWLDAFDNECASLIISNPPYLAADDPHLSNPALTHEPGAALVAAEAGLADIRQIVKGCTRVACKGCTLMLEHGHEQGASVRQIMHDAGLTLVETVTDLAGNDRVTRGVSQS